MPFAATWMDLEIVILSELSHTEKEKSYDITYRCYLKNDTNKDISTEKYYHRFIKKTCGSPTGKVCGLDTLPY